MPTMYKKLQEKFLTNLLQPKMLPQLTFAIIAVIATCFRNAIYQILKNYMQMEQLLTILLLILIVLALVLIDRKRYSLNLLKIQNKLEQLEKDSIIHKENKDEINKLNKLLDKKFDNINEIANLKVSRILKEFYTNISL